MIRALPYTFAVLASLGLAALAPAHQTPTPPKPVEPSALWRPTAVPDRIILTWNDNPATTQAVTWRTDTSVTKAVAQIAVAEAGPKLADKAATVEAHSTPLTTNLGEAHYHSVTFRGLKPNTKYAYRVGDGVNWSEWAHFRTAADQPEPFTFIYLGDAQNDIKSLWSRVAREAYSGAPEARFILHAGDLVNFANNDAEWAEWHYGAGWVNASVPSIPTPGNHEYASRALSTLWRPQFTLPENGLKGLEETNYFIDYQGVRIISLNSNERQEEQAAWLDGILKNNPNRWTVITFHHPIFNAARGRDNAQIRNLWKPIFDKYRVDLVLQGHDHTYARSNLNTGVNARTEEGTVFVVSVAGPKMYNLEREPWMQRAAEDTQLFQIIRVERDRIRYEARTAVGELYDAFELRKRPGRPNELRNIPKITTPERLRQPATK